MKRPAPSAGAGPPLGQRSRTARPVGRVEVVHDDPDHCGLRISLIDQPWHLVGKVLHRPTCRDGNVSPTGLRLNQHTEMAGAVALVRIVVPRRSSRGGGPGLACLPKQLFACCIEVALRASGIIGGCVEVQRVLHGGHALGAHVRQTSWLLRPQFECVFLSTWRTLSWAMASAKPRATTLSASSRNVHRAWPLAAGVQATAITGASCVPVHWRCAPGRACSSSAPRFSSTHRCRVRPTVAVPTGRAVALSSSRRPSSALSSIRARVSWRVLAFPRRRSCAHVTRAAVLKATRDCLLGLARLSSRRVGPACDLIASDSSTAG